MGKPKRSASLDKLPNSPAEALPSPIGEGSGVRQKKKFSMFLIKYAIAAK